MRFFYKLFLFACFLVLFFLEIYWMSQVSLTSNFSFLNFTSRFPLVPSVEVSVVPSIGEDVNTNMIATLSIDQVLESVPIVQSSDNFYYLNHSIDHHFDPLGTPFLDYRNHITDRKLLIYGHNSKSISTKFHVLERYLEPDFLKNHAIITLQSASYRYRYQIFSILIVTSDFQHMKLDFTEKTYWQHLKWLKEHSIYDTFVEIEQTDQILILQTCYYRPENSYLLVVGRKI